jgi:preprotein translocase subunit SecA
MKTLEKFATLWIIDDEWKEHLREMDELKQSAQNAVFEQKDPLLIYKLESFNLFKSMISRLNKEVMSMLFKAYIPAQNANPIQEAPVQQRKQEKLQTSRTDDLAEAQRAVAEARSGNTSDVQKVQQIKGVVKIGRNDPCPCGSGKKYKSCHGKED